jgi:hypothetical protein
VLDATTARNQERTTRRLTLPVLAISGDEGYSELTATMMRLAADDVQSVIIPNRSHRIRGCSMGGAGGVGPASSAPSPPAPPLVVHVSRRRQAVSMRQNNQIGTPKTMIVIVELLHLTAAQ